MKIKSGAKMKEDKFASYKRSIYNESKETHIHIGVN